MPLRLFIILCLLASHFSYADSWLNKVKSGYKQVKESVTSQSNKESKPTISLPNNMPEDWHYSYFQEPIFDSKIAILQTGMQHKQSILLVHGLGQLGMKDWYSTIPFLAKKYHIIAIDLPGFGYSEKPSGRYSPTNYALILNAVVETFSKQKLNVIGHSMGGAVSLRFSAITTKPIDKLVLVDVAGILEKTAFIKHTSKLPVNENIIPPVFKNIMVQLNDVGGSIVEMTSINSISKFIESSDLTWDLVKSNSNINAAVSLIEEDFSQLLPQIDVDTTIIWGELDNVAPLRTGKVLGVQIKGAKLHVIKGADHVPMKSHSDEFQHLLASALAPSKVSKAPKLVSNTDKKTNLLCDGKNDQIYSGSYNEIILKNCSNIQLININANKMDVIDSLVNAENLTLHSEGRALTAIESVINMTNAKIETQQALKLSGSRVDAAGVELIAFKNSINVDVESKIIFSVSSIHDQFYQGTVHGAFKLKEQNISQLLNKTEKNVN